MQLAADATLASGERLLTVLGDPAEERDAREFGRYWAVGRTRLDVARASAVAAIAAADSALACSAAGCGAVMTRQVGSHAGAAAAAAREAESVLRIAIGFVQ